MDGMMWRGLYNPDFNRVKFDTPRGFNSIVMILVILQKCGDKI